MGGKLSLLFLYRRIFGMRTKWFKYSWYAVFVLVCPIWFVTAIVWASLGIAHTVSLVVELNYAVPIITIINTITDVLMLALPLGMTAQLQLTKKQRASIMVIFALGSTWVFKIPVPYALLMVIKRNHRLSYPLHTSVPISAGALGPEI